LGWEVYRARFPDDAWIAQRRLEKVSRLSVDLAYFRFGTTIAGLTLRLLHWGGEVSGGVVRMVPGLAFVLNPFAAGHAREDSWLLDLEFLAADLASEDHVTVIAFERFRRQHGGGSASNPHGQ
jgi:hypothetical protein